MTVLADRERSTGDGTGDEDQADQLASLVLAGADDPRLRWEDPPRWLSGYCRGGVRPVMPGAAPDHDVDDEAWEARRAVIRQRKERLAKAMLGIGWEQVDTYGYGPWYPAEMAAGLRRECGWRRAGINCPHFKGFDPDEVIEVF